jgi:hypothetical protein
MNMAWYKARTDKGCLSCGSGLGLFYLIGDRVPITAPHDKVMNATTNRDDSPPLHACTTLERYGECEAQAGLVLTPANEYACSPINLPLILFIVGQHNT